MIGARLVVAASVVMTIGCGAIGGGERTSQLAKLGSLSFALPDDWQRTDSTVGDAVTSVWTPSGANDAKESVTIVRIERAAQKVGDTPLDLLLAGAQGTLRDARISHRETISTPQGFTGARLRVAFKPAGQDRIYRRAHATLRDGTALVHVLYTAAEPDETFEVFHTVLETIRHEEG